MPHTQPNILFIVLDTLRRDHLSAYGHTIDTSPALDEFADRATLFERAVAPAQWTIPAHASLFTGVYPGVHGVTQANSALSGMHPTLAEILQVGGYHTIAFCNNPLVGVLDNGLQRGFDHFYHYSSAIPNRPADMHQNAMRRQMVKWFRPYARKMGNQFAKSDRLFRLSLHPLLTPVWSKYINFKGSTADSIDDLMTYWTAHHAGGAEQPLFSFVNLMGAHLPYHPPQDWVAKIAPDLKNDRAAYAFMRRFNADGAGWASPPDTPFDEFQRHVLNTFYDAEIAYQDAQLGRLLTFLRESGALDNTAVIIAADHGEAHGEHQMMGHGFNVYQELVHVPLLMHLPDADAGQRVPVNVSTRRLFHTVLDIAGVKPPLDARDPNADVEGLSLANFLRASDGRGRDAENNSAFSEAYPPTTFLHVLEHRSPAVIERLRLRFARHALYTGDHKMVVDAGRVEGLFDIHADPTEARDAQFDSPTETAALLRTVESFTTGQTIPHAAGDADVTEEVTDHLRALGYID